MIEILNTLRFAVFRMVLVPQRDVEFLGFKGNVFRGALGQALRRLTCVVKDPASSCHSCLLHQQCIYAKIFESTHQLHGSILDDIDSAPHPFVLHLPDRYRLTYPAHAPIPVELTLIGDVIEYLPYFILVFEELGRKGIGITRAPFVIAQVSCGDTQVYLPHEKRINQQFPVYRGSAWHNQENDTKKLHIELLTPLRLKFAGQFQKLITFEMLIRNLLRRVHLLSALYCAGPKRVDFKDLIDKAQTVTHVDSEFHWEQQSRFSFRQEKNITLGGVSGWLEVVGELGPFMSFLRLGEFLHVGKSTAFGLGKIALKKQELDGKVG